MRILIIEDDPTVFEALVEGLTAAGHAVQGCMSGEKGLDALQESPFDAIILDVGLPGMSGHEVATRLRQEGDPTPILMLTARSEEEDIVQGLDFGADGYMTKPFSVPELLARLRAFERRETLTVEALLTFAGLELDQVSREVTYRGTKVRLTEVEFKILATFVKNPGRVVSRDEMFREVWRMDFDPGTVVFDVHLSNLRRKLKAAGPPLIENVRGVGYRIVKPSE